MSLGKEHDPQRFHDVVLYFDCDSEPLREHVESLLKSLSLKYRIVSRRDFMPPDAPSPANRVSTTLALLQRWQAEEADVYTRDVNKTVSFIDELEVLITEKDTSDGSVTYALHRRQMPVLSLATARAPIRTAAERILYMSAASDTLDVQQQAVSEFLTFPATRGAFVEVPAGAASSDGAAVVVNSDSYPIRIPPHIRTVLGAPSDTAASTDANQAVAPAALLPPPPTLFSSAATKLCTSEDSNMEVLRRRNPLLPGLLKAFDRYQNRGLLRAMLHRGYRVEVAPDTQTAAAVRQFIALTKPGTNAQEEKVAVATLAEFESHWLEQQLPAKAEQLQ